MYVETSATLLVSHMLNAMLLMMGKIYLMRYGSCSLEDHFNTTCPTADSSLIFGAQPRVPPVAHPFGQGT